MKIKSKFQTIVNRVHDCFHSFLFEILINFSNLVQLSFTSKKKRKKKFFFPFDFQLNN
jgi:hypothetical protein